MSVYYQKQGMGCTSCPDAIARVIMKVSKIIEEQSGETVAPTAPAAVPVQQSQKVPASASEIHACPECGSVVEHEGGCVICRNCGFSKCG